MTRGIYTKWIIGAVFLLLIFACACIWYYYYTESVHNQLLQEIHDDLKQRCQRWGVKVDTGSKTTESAAENITPTAEKPTNNVVTTKPEAKQAQSAAPAQTAAAEVRVSKFGFGPYPELPADFPFQDLFDPPYYSEDPNDSDKDNPAWELMDRLWVELWKRGENVEGMGTRDSTGLFYPTIRGTIYVEWAPRWKVFGQEFGRMIRAVNGHPDDVAALEAARQEGHPLLESDIPSHLKVLEMSEGIDPYRFLNLTK